MRETRPPDTPTTSPPSSDPLSLSASHADFPTTVVALSNFRRGTLRGLFHTVVLRNRGAGARDLVPPPARAIPRFARVRKLTSANLTADLAVKNLLDVETVDRSARSSGVFQQGKSNLQQSEAR